MVFGVDEQDDVEVALERWVRLARAVLDDAGPAGGVRPGAEMTLVFVDEAAMTDLNREHMGGDGPTDVLAFPIDDEGVEPGRWPDNGSSGPDRRPVELDELPILIGDVVVCPTVAAGQAPEHGVSVDDELALLVVHGVLHVLGMDHAEDDERIAMQARERDLLARFHHDGSTER
mgnify:CR=1 FL=1